MKTREQIIKAFEQCLVHGPGNCEDCYQDGPGFGILCWKNVCSDVLELLKEQEAVVRCKDCIHWDKGYTEECDNLDSVCFHNGWCKPDWFCADGERKEGR